MQIPIRVVLVETSHPGNIGACARAMKTMGLTDLALVRPRQFPHAEASALASGADDLLTSARVCDTLAEALGECSLVIGTSARSRTVAWTTVSPRQAAREMHAHSVAAAARHLSLPAAAIVMGPEKTGLTNEDLARCGWLVQIPANPIYSSLNLAMAVQVLSYELRVAWLESVRPAAGDEAMPVHGGDAPGRAFHPGSNDMAPAPPAAQATPAPPAPPAPPATAMDLEGLHEHMERVLTDAGFLHPDHPHQLKLKLRRLFHRASLDRDEINILRGMLAALDPERRRRLQ